MFKRAGALSAIPLSLAMAAVMLSASAVSARASKVITIEEVQPCHFLVTYSWSGMGHGNDLRAVVRLSAWEGTNSSSVGAFSFKPVSGQAGEIWNEFEVHGQNSPVEFKGSGYLQIDRQSSTIAKSEIYSVAAPGGPKTCP